ncbi:hypothetical protein SAMN04490248_10162 [Salinihabitans flavidus]|uniref:Histidine kinase n=1 Tax=Salinihabitans flavidus TaxID=569882 RepID=A0A1H8LAG1_9RHOB|nr:DUF6446 family protein [Salinihabitans flavidus]SEO02142.1 hypothetical protein SAMN04490248_10162 [Salinihabitans flavidus]
MTGKIIGSIIVITALIAGGAIYYLQLYAFYDEVSATGTGDVQATLLVTQEPEPILYDNFRGIDANSSPIRYRACFTTTMSLPMMSETYVPYEDAEPLVAPGWFDCFDAEEIGAALEAGEALAFLGRKNIHYGIDRVVAVMPDGRGFVWHQINDCGEIVFDGRPAPDYCPPKPEGQ